MATIGYKLSSEEQGPLSLVRYAGMAEQAGFRFGVISDQYDLPERPPPLIVAAAGPSATALAAKIGDGFMGVAPSKETIDRFHTKGGSGPIYGEVTVCYAPDEAAAKHQEIRRRRLRPRVRPPDRPRPRGPHELLTRRRSSRTSNPDLH